MTRTITWTDFSDIDTAHATSASSPFETLRDPWAASRVALERLRGLGDDWDGLGGAAPPQDVVDSAMQLIAILRGSDFAPPSRITPSPDGAIALEWQTNSGKKLQAEVSTPGVVELSYKERGQEPLFHEEIFGVLDEVWLAKPSSPGETAAAA